MERREEKSSISRTYILKVSTIADAHERRDIHKSAIFLVPFKESANIFDDILIYTLKENKSDKIIEILQREPLRTIIDILKKYDVIKSIRKLLERGYPVIFYCESYMKPPVPAVII